MTRQAHNVEKNKTPLWLAIAGLFATGLITASVAHAQITEPHQTPLIVSGSGDAPPNIAILYDDSGSMANVAIPDAAASMGASSLHPNDTGSTNGSAVLYVIPTDENEIYSKVVRSHQINPLYYDPATTYEPWKKADGEPVIARKDVNPKKIPVFANMYNGVFPRRHNTIDLTFVEQPFDFATLGITNSGLVNTEDGTLKSTRYICRKYPSSISPDCTVMLVESAGVAVVRKFTPAIYYEYIGPDVNDSNFSKWSLTNPNLQVHANYRKVVIAQIPASGEKQKGSRTDCAIKNADGTVQCTAEEEMQNFAVWYVFYRDRIRAATGALTQVFGKKYDINFRLGWWSLNRANMSGVRQFALNEYHAVDFFKWLYAFENQGANGGTATTRRLDDIGKYFMSDEPWYENPANPDKSKPMLACRRNHTIVMTDGGWNDATIPVNAVTLAGTTTLIKNATATKEYQYKGVKDSATKNHPYYAPYDTPSLARTALHYWTTDLRPDLPNILSGDPSKDKYEEGLAFWQNMVTHTIGFGMRGSFKDPDDLEALKTGSLAWGDAYNASDGAPAKADDLWHAALTGRGTHTSADDLTKLIDGLNSIITNIAVGELTSSHSAILTDNLLSADNMLFAPQYTAGKWSGDLSAYEIKIADPTSPKVIDINRMDPKWKASDNMPDHGDRNIWVGVDNGSGVEAVEFTWGSISIALKDDLNKDKKLLDFIRGDNSRTEYRTRDDAYKLGDIVNSNPTVAKERPNLGYDFLPGYKEYRVAMQARSGMVFVGANDGMLHGFDTNTGVEKFAYIPYGITHKLSQLAAKDYEKKHTYFVDGQLSLADVNSGGVWKNILIGTAGAGGKSIFAIDVTAENNYTDGSAVLWDISEKTTGFERMGHIMQPIQTGYAKTGDWIGVFGNGAYGEDGHAMFYVVDLQTGALMKTITVDTAGDNGLMGVTLVRDKEQNIIEAYGTDLKGNLWRVKLDDTNYAGWGSPHKLFTTHDGRAITQAPITKEHPKKGRMVVFGTGKFFDESDRDDASEADALYGIWDKGTDDFIDVAVDNGGLIERTLDAQFNHIGVTRAINWDVDRGWFMPLKMGKMQRSLYSPRPIGTDAFFNTTTIDTIASGSESCESGALGGITLLLDMLSGGKAATGWDTNGDGIIDDNDASGVVDTEGPGHIITDPNLGLNTGGYRVTDASGRLISPDVIDNYSWVTLR